MWLLRGGAERGVLLRAAGEFVFGAVAQGAGGELVGPLFGGGPVLLGPQVENGDGGLGLDWAGRGVFNDEVSGFARICFGEDEGDACEGLVAGFAGGLGEGPLGGGGEIDGGPELREVSHDA